MTVHILPLKWSNDVVRSVGRQLLPTRHLVRLAPIALIAVFACVVVRRSGLVGDAMELMMAGAIAIALSTTFKDNAAGTLAASPTSPMFRASARLALVIPTALACWIVARGVASQAFTTTWSAAYLPNREAWLVLVVTVTVVLAIEATTTKAGAVAGLTGSITVPVAAIVALHLPAAIAVFPVEQHSLRWLGALAISFPVLVIALTDPGLRKS